MDSPLTHVRSPVTNRSGHEPVHRIGALDALRGLAATAVVFSHIHNVFFPRHIFLDLTPLRLFWVGGEAVILFFVLSGYVLSAPFCRTDEPIPFGKFLTTRITRIYFPYFAAIACALLLSIFVYNETAAASHHFLGKRWPHPIDWTQLLQHALLVGNFNTQTYNEVIWSLVHEMRFAIVFPAFIWLLRNFSWRSCLTLCTAISLGAGLATTAGLDVSQGFKNSYLYSAHYLLFFMLGGLLAKHSAEIGALISGLGKNKIRLLAVLAFILFVYSSLAYSFSVKMRWGVFAELLSFLSDWGVGVGSSLLIALAIHHVGFSTLLNRQLFLFLGKISFSLYLVHVLVLATALHLLSDFPTVLIVIIAFPIIFVAAYAFHRLIEKPSQKLGHRMFPKNPKIARTGDAAVNT